MAMSFVAGTIAVLAVAGAVAITALALWAPRRLLALTSALHPARLVLTQIVVLSWLLAALTFGLTLGAKASFTASVVTETLQVTVGPGDRTPRWPRPTRVQAINAQLPADCAEPTFAFLPGRTAPFTARFTRLAPGTSGAGQSGAGPSEVDASGSNDAAATHPSEGRGESGLRVILDGAGQSLGTLSCADGVSRPAPSRLRLEFAPAAGRAAPTLPVDGEFRIGGDVVDQLSTDPARPTPLLLSGVLAVEARSWPAPTGRARSETPLQLGDIVTFLDDRSDGTRVPAPATGLVRPGETPLDDKALMVVAHADAQRAQVERRSVSDSIPIAYAPTLWTRMQAMGEWTVLLVIAGVGLELLRAFEHYRTTQRRKPADED